MMPICAIVGYFHIFAAFSSISVPNVSFRVYAPGFLNRFMESHAVMFQGNSGLKPKEGEVTSRPWQWPINYRVSIHFVCNEFFIVAVIALHMRMCTLYQACECIGYNVQHLHCKSFSENVRRSFLLLLLLLFISAVAMPFCSALTLSMLCQSAFFTSKSL